MKRSFLSILVSVICCITMLCICANAQAPELIPDENARYNLDYIGTPGEFYFMLVLDGTYYEGDERVLTEESILYIAQQKADENGVASFSGFRPKPCEEATVFISGGNIERIK